SAPHDPGTVLGGGEGGKIKVRRREALAGLDVAFALAERFAEEEQRRARAVADRGLGDDDGHRQEALAVEQELGGVEGTVLRIAEGLLVVLGPGRREVDQRNGEQPESMHTPV